MLSQTVSRGSGKQLALHLIRFMEAVLYAPGVTAGKILSKPHKLGHNTRDHLPRLDIAVTEDRIGYTDYNLPASTINYLRRLRSRMDQN